MWTDFEIDSRPRRVSDEQLNWEARIAEIARDLTGPKRRLIIAADALLGGLKGDQVRRLKELEQGECPASQGGVGSDA